MSVRALIAIERSDNRAQGNWNVAKIDLADGRAVSLLDYQDFAERAFPALRQSSRVDLQTGAVCRHRFVCLPPSSSLRRNWTLTVLRPPGITLTKSEPIEL